MWKTKKIADICDIRRGSSPRPIQKFLDIKGMPWVKISDATSSNSRYIESTVQFIKEEGISKSVKVYPETLILSNSATPGLPKIMKICACVHDGWLILSNFRGVKRDYIYYKLLNIQKDIINQANGSVFQNLKTDIIRNFNIEIPPIEYQDKLANFFSKIDDAIYYLNKINDNLEQQAQAIFKKNFIECIEKDIVTLSDYCSFVKGKNPKLVADYFKKDYELYLNIDTLTNNKISYTTPDCLIKAGEKDILMVMDGASSGTVYFGKNGVVGSTIAKIVTLDDNMREIIYQALKYYENDIKNHTTGSAIPHTDKQYVLQLKISLPKNYHMFSTYFEKIRELIISNRNKNNILKSLRDTLLPKLMSGEIDVSNIKV